MGHPEHQRSVGTLLRDLPCHEGLEPRDSHPPGCSLLLVSILARRMPHGSMRLRGHWLGPTSARCLYKGSYLHETHNDGVYSRLKSGAGTRVVLACFFACGLILCFFFYWVEQD